MRSLRGQWLVFALLIGLSVTQRIDNPNQDFEEDYISDDGRYQEFSAGKGGKFSLKKIFLKGIKNSESIEKKIKQAFVFDYSPWQCFVLKQTF